MNGSENLKFKIRIDCLTYNHSKYVNQALDGFCIQEFSFPFICLIIDDYSNDGEQNVIKEYLEINFNIEGSDSFSEETDDFVLTFARHKTNLNCYFAVYFLKYNHYRLQKLKGPYLKENWRNVKYVACCEGDDYWTDPLKLQKQVDALETHPECSISIGKVLTVDKNNNPLDLEIPPKSFNFPELITLKDLAECQFKKGLWAFQTSTYVVRKDIFDLNLKFRKTFMKNFPFGDLPLLITALLKGKGYYLDEPLGVYRHMSGGYTSKMQSNPELAILNEQKIIQAFRDLDDATNHEYHEQFIFRIMQGELKIARLSHKIKPLFKKEFIPSYKEWGIKKTSKEILPIIFPKLYKTYVKIKGRG